MRRLALLIIAIAAVSGAPVSQAGVPPHDAAVVATAGEYVPRYVPVPRGWGLLFTNADPLGHHDLISLDADATGRALFATQRLAGFGDQVPVVGVEQLPAGAHPFACTVHPAMYGELLVV